MGLTCADDGERLDFFKDLTTKVNKPVSQDAYVYALVARAEVKLKLEDEEGARKDLNEAESILDTFDSVETEVHAAFYRTNAIYYQVRLTIPVLSNPPLISYRHRVISLHITRTLSSISPVSI